MWTSASWRSYAEKRRQLRETLLVIPATAMVKLAALSEELPKCSVRTTPRGSRHLILQELALKNHCGYGLESLVP